MTGLICTEKGNCHFIADVRIHRPEGEPQIPAGEDLANAKFIVNACNSHAALLEALQKTADWLARSTRIDDREQADDARAVIAAATK
jgi:hypothetical protein